MKVRQWFLRAARVGAFPLFLPVVPIVVMPPSLGVLHAQEVEETLPDSIAPEEVLAGSDIYNNRSCQFCHALAGKGSGTRAPDLSDVEWLHSEGDLGGILQTIFWGVKKEEMKAVAPRPFQMNPRGGLTNISNRELLGVAAYVWSLSRPQTNEFIAQQHRFLDLARGGRTGEAIEVFRSAQRRWADHLLLPENGLNNLGYQLMGGGDLDGAIAMFELNVDLHPESWNPWDSLAEAYMNRGDTDRAIENYEKSLQLNPDNTNAVDKLQELRGG